MRTVLTERGTISLQLVTALTACWKRSCENSYLGQRLKLAAQLNASLVEHITNLYSESLSGLHAAKYS